MEFVKKLIMLLFILFICTLTASASEFKLIVEDPTTALGLGQVAFKERRISFYDDSAKSLFKQGIYLRYKEKKNSAQFTVKVRGQLAKVAQASAPVKGLDCEEDIQIYQSAYSCSLISDGNINDLDGAQRDFLNWLKVGDTRYLKAYGPVSTREWAIKDKDVGDITVEYWFHLNGFKVWEISGRDISSIAIFADRMKKRGVVLAPKQLPKTDMVFDHF